MNVLKNSSDFKFYVLGLGKSFRGDSLVKDLETHYLCYEFIEGIDGRTSAINPSAEDLFISEYYSNRAITSTEIATTLGHWKMFRKARSDGTQFAVFLEDDGYILDIDKLFCALNEIRSTYERNNQNSIWLLLHRRYNSLGFRKKSTSSIFSRTYLIPTSAAAYVINLEGLKKIPQAFEIPYSTGFLPDFPLHYADKLKFYTPSMSLIDVTGVESLIGNQRWLESRASNYGFSKQLLIFTCVSWFQKGYKYSSLKAHLMFFHGRKVVHILLTFENGPFRWLFRKRIE
jgi:GR25 family glycosyltransferase involved in LPS biosynthesis